MAPLADCSAELSEIQRLNHLLQIEMKSQVFVVQSTTINSPLIAAVRIKKHQFAIQIDFMQWQELAVRQRDLLFWHEVARIQAQTVPQFGWEMPVMLLGTGLALMEISAQNVISLSAALVAVGLAAYQLYQRNRGEQSLREAVNADCRAIHFATEFGYSFSEATISLYDALKLLARSAQKSGWKRQYQVRLRALEILMTERTREGARQLHQPQALELSWQR